MLHLCSEPSNASSFQSKQLLLSVVQEALHDLALHSPMMMLPP